MKIDLTSVMRQAQEEVSSAESKGSNNSGYPVVYPGEKGKITFRILYNMKSQTVQRRIVRHEKLPCFGIYGEDCPVCTAIKNAEEVKGRDCGAFRKYGYKIRGLCFAKVVDADTAYSDKFKKDDTIILMYPKSVYESINKIIVDAGENLEKIVSHNDGIPIVIETSQKNGYPDYSVYLFPYGSQKSFQEDNGEELFDQLLESIPSLSDIIIPSHPTEEDRQRVNALAETITQEFIYGNVVNPGDGKNGDQNSQPSKTGEETKSINPAFNGTPSSANEDLKENNPAAIPDGVPECFGKHSETENKCLICSHESQCFMKTYRG